MPPETTIDVKALYAAIDQKRQSRGLSWRDLASELKISPSTFTRMAQERRPDVDTFASLVRWLSVEAEAFMRPATKKTDAWKTDPEPVAMISSYLRSARNVTPKEAKALEDIIQAAYRHLKGM